MEPVPGNKAVFLDRDGVIVIPEFRDGRSYAPRTLQDYRFYPDALDSLQRLKTAGYLLIVVTNQPDLANGLISQSVMAEMHRRLMADLPIDSIKLCPHSQTANCGCRKPAPKLLLEAAREHNILLDRSFMIGDRASDVAAGQAAGCRTIFIDLGYSEPKPRDATYSVRSFREAADVVLSANQS